MKLSERFAGMNQAAFAREHRVPGGASMISQHIHGHRPIQLTAAIAYARGFGVGLAEISPRLAAQVAGAGVTALSTEAGPSKAVTASEPLPPPLNFADRHWVSESDWGLLEDVKLILDDEEISSIRKRAEKLKARSDQMVEARMAAAVEATKNGKGADS